MDYTRLGRSELKVSRLCLGLMSFGDQTWAKWVRGESECNAMVKLALANGINFFDTADVYSFGESERLLGRAIRGLARRDEVIIATKFGLGVPKGEHGLTRKNVLAAADASLQRLGTDYIDLYQMHGWDPAVDIEETMGALHDLVKQGKIRHAGASNFFAWQLLDAHHKSQIAGLAGLKTMQFQYNLAYREEERELIPVCERYDFGTIVFSPLARGYLAGIRNANVSASEAVRAASDAKAQRVYGHGRDHVILDELAAIAGRHKVPGARLALGWVLSQPSIGSVIVGPTEPEHLSNALEALKFKLSEDERTALERAYQPRATETTEIARVPF
jgi:aryl-alcohol dehydrogenase (NADP+)